MKLSKIGRISMAFVVSVAMGLGMTACGGGTVGFMWVLGTQYNQIAGFKIDNFTGNLTQIPHSPFASGGTSPVSLTVKPGGRFVYVVNQGTDTSPTCTTGGATTGVAGSVSQFTVGGDGVLTFQQNYASAGCSPVWVTVDSSGSFLYVLDKLAPNRDPINAPTQALDGDITVFAIDGITGRLTLQQNQLVKNANGTLLTYFEVGPKPTMVRNAGGCVYTLDSGDNTIFPYQAGTGGQLTSVPNGKLVTNASRLTSINTGGSFTYLTDAGANQILTYQAGSSGCALSASGTGPVANFTNATNPVYSLTSSNGKFLYVLNQSTTSTTNNQAYSSISAFTVLTNGTLQPLGDTENPYKVGSGPVCIAQDPTNQYVYTSNSVAGTVTGKLINQNTGQLSDLRRGSDFAATGLPTCLVISGNVN